MNNNTQLPTVNHQCTQRYAMVSSVAYLDGDLLQCNTDVEFVVTTAPGPSPYTGPNLYTRVEIADEMVTEKLIKRQPGLQRAVGISRSKTWS